MPYPNLQTPRLTLSFFNPERESDCAKIYQSYNHPVGIARKGKTVRTRADIDVRAQTSALPAAICHKSPPPAYSLILCHVKDSDEYVGFVAPFHREEDKTSAWGAQLGWSILPEYWGRGYATEAATAMVKWCDEVLGLERVAAQMDVDNVASVRVAEKAGGLARANTGLNGVSEGVVEFEWVFRNSS